MAPVARGIADGEENGLVLGGGLVESFIPPGIPVHWIVGVLKKVRALFIDEPV